MTMFKKVFGNQMAAATQPQEAETEMHDPVPQLVAPPEDTSATPPPRSQPYFAPLPQVLTTKEDENAARRAEKEAEVQERMKREQSAAQTPMSEPVAEPQIAAAPTPIAPVAPVPAAVEPAVVPVPSQPSVTPPARPAGRARTRLLGFGGAQEASADPMAGPISTPAVQQFPTGWIVVIAGEGRGHFFPLFNGVSSVGRDAAQAIALNFGDMTISRENHAAIAYDEEDNQFYVGHGGKSNIIRLNGRPVLSTESLSHGDTLRIGETVLRFAAFCGGDFDWTAEQND